MEQNSNSVLRRFRNDRRKLLEYLLSSGFITEIRTPAGPTTSLSHLNLDSLSADYILDCVKSGGVVDVSEASEKYVSESAYPVVTHSKQQNFYYLTTDPNATVSPPRRVPPPINTNENKMSHSSSQLDPLIVEKTVTSREDCGLNHKVSAASNSEENNNFLSLGLPRLKTGLSDDDLRESAYEILLGSLLFSGVEIHSTENRKKDRSSKLLSGLRSKRDKTNVQTQPHQRYSEIISIVRVQMEISETMDACTRRALVPLATRTCEIIDVPQISLGLLNGIFMSDFSSKKSYLHWKGRQASILEELLCSSSNLTTNEASSVKSSLATIKMTEEWDIKMSSSERVGVLLAIRQVASKLSSLTGKFGLQSENCYWTSAYHLNVRLYEKLLFGIFDALDEGQLIAEADEILLLIKTTWSALGITQTMHNAIYGWVLLQQFVVTGEATLLDYAIVQLRNVLCAGVDDKKEGQYLSSLVCSMKYKGRKIKLSFIQAILYAISIWCDTKLQDYHLHFSQDPGRFNKVMALAAEVGLLTSNVDGESEFTKQSNSNVTDTRKLKTYVKRSIKAAYKRVEGSIDVDSYKQKHHPLALLAKKLRLIAEIELKSFSPILSQWFARSGVIAAMLLHQFYGERLKPFLEEVSCLNEDAKAVLSAAYMLDRDLTNLYHSARNDSSAHGTFNQTLEHYKIGDVSKPLVLDWVISQHSHILEWTGRAFDLEEWEPLSSHQRQAASIVEVFRILEETVNQFFGLNLPLDITHLQALLSIIYHNLDAYLNRLLNQLVGKNHLYPCAPPLTRYAETYLPMMKKRLHESTLLDEDVKSKLKELTVSKLCVRLNTLEYIQKQVGTLEDGIRKSWALVGPLDDKRQDKEQHLGSQPCSEAVDELFVTTFNSLRDTTSDAITKIYDLTGARVVFLDMRATFLNQLYRGNVEGARMDNFLQHFDAVLDQICDLIDDNLRDSAVLSILRASLQGYIWILLNGGPSRAFDESDFAMMEEDLHLLKEFFIADGEGLPRSLVEQEAKSAEMILSLFSLQSESLIQMLMIASEHISSDLEPRQYGYTCVQDAHTLMRVLCHKKDREASKFLKNQYQLPSSSDYDDTLKESASNSPFVSDLLKRSTSVHWSKKGRSSFKSIKKKLKEAKSEIRHAA